MAIISIKMVSGYTPNKPSVKKLEKQFPVQRVDMDANHVLLYLEKLTNVTRSYSFKVEQTFVVQDLKPAFAEVYDYYEKEEYAVAEYSAPCSKAKHGNA
uniref:Alpha-macroglobulin receptor-binding domain-containing protein n=1 Tax=Ailuropoda melanoleuca TaxID=9646 RepID=A0A7N5K9H1_AILME